MPWNWHVHPRVGLTTQASPAPQAPSHAGKLALPHGALPPTHSHPFPVAAQMGLAAGHSPQQSGCGGDIGSPQGSGGADVVEGPEVVVVMTMLVLDDGVELVVVIDPAIDAGTHSSRARSTSSVSARIWLSVDTGVRAVFGPRTR